LACAGSFTVILDATIVSVALPDIRTDLRFTPASLPWVVNAYTLVFAGFLLLGGRCADVFGARRIMLLGMTLFTVARVAAGLATTPALLLDRARRPGARRCVAHPGHTFLAHQHFHRSPRAYSSVGHVERGRCGRRRGRTVIGGVLTQWAGWRWFS